MGEKAVTTANFAASVLQNASATTTSSIIAFGVAGALEGYLKSKVDLPYDVNPRPNGYSE